MEVDSAADRINTMFLFSLKDGSKQAIDFRGLVLVPIDSKGLLLIHFAVDLQ